MSDSQTHVTFLAPETAQLAPHFPGYEIETLIATGGMGAVYRAIQKSLDRTVAIKILPQEFSKDAAFCEGFEAEAKAMARLNHPNLIGVYDFGEVDGMLYIIMEYVPGKSLFHSAHGIAIDTGEVIRLVTGICNGLAHAHENGILHRDIKPSNILLDLNAQPKIGDFGLARPIERKIQEGEEIFGTPHYTAPEVVNSPQSVGYRADIFSVGVLLHELLTGRLPADDRRAASAIVHCDPRFDVIIRRATNPLPEARYSSAAEIAKDLNAIAISAGPKVLRTANPMAAVRPAPAVIRPGTTTKSSSSVPGIIMLVIAIVIAAVTYNQISKRQAPAPPPTTEPSPGTTKVPDTKPVRPVTPTHPEPEPISDNKPGPEPSPLDKPDPGPEPTPIVDNKPEPEPMPDPSETLKPKFDVAAFMERARKIMQERANPMITARDENLLRNLEDFERAVKRQIRKLDFGRLRDRAEETLEKFIAQCREAGNRIPAKLDKEMAYFSEIDVIHEEYLNKQVAIDETLMQSLTQLTALYILGLEKQIARLKTDNDPAAISLIEQEIEKSRTTVEYFPYLMLGIDLEALKKAAEEEKAKKAAADKEAAKKPQAN